MAANLSATDSPRLCKWMPTSSALVVNERHNYSVALKNENWWWSRTQSSWPLLAWNSYIIHCHLSDCLAHCIQELLSYYVLWFAYTEEKTGGLFRVSLISSWNYFILRKIPRKIPPCTVFISAELIYMNSAGHPNCSLLKPSHNVWFRHRYHLRLIILQTQVYYVCIWK